MTKEYVEKIKNCKWEDKEKLPLPYLLDVIELFNTKLDVSKCHESSYLPYMFTFVITSLRTKWKIQPSKGQLNECYLLHLYNGNITKNILFERMITLKPTRSNSGELEVTTILPGDGMSCKYDCAMCPDQPGIARSYLTSEGTTILGILEQFHPFQQTLRRLIQYEYKMGHSCYKILHILLGGTFHSYDVTVVEHYITNLYYCCNMYKHFSIRKNGIFSSDVQLWLDQKPFLNHLSVMNGPLADIIRSSLRPMKTLQEEKEENTMNEYCRITGIVIETRPDQISYHSLFHLRRLGVTRIQLGIQHTDKTVLQIMNRKHDVAASIRGIRYARDNGFKVDGHLMPDCPGSTYEKDFIMLQDVFQGEDLQLDYCKLYICLDVPFTKIRLWKQNAIVFDEKDTLLIENCMKTGDFQTLDAYAKQKHLTREDIYVWRSQAEHEYPRFFDLLLKSIQLIPPWTRLNRFQRDFPTASTRNERIGYESRTMKTNQQQLCMESLQAHGLRSYDIRSREVRNRIFQDLAKQSRLYFRFYRANQGIEFFISVEIPLQHLDYNDSILLGMIRLRLPDWDLKKAIDPMYRKNAPSHYLNTFKKKSTLRVRELHTYGNLQSYHDQGNAQHRGIGKFLMSITEHIASILNVQQIAVIAGVGVRNYYQRLGYHLNSVNDGEYMTKVTPPFDAHPHTTLFGNVYTLHDISYILANSRFLQSSGLNYRLRMLTPFTKNVLIVYRYRYESLSCIKPELLVVQYHDKKSYYHIIGYFVAGLIIMYLFCTSGVIVGKPSK